MKDEYDFSKGVRGKYSKKYKEGTNIVLLDPKLRDSFPDDQAVNKALHEFLEIKKTEAK